MMIVGTMQACCLERKAVLFVAESQLLNQCLAVENFDFSVE